MQFASQNRKLKPVDVRADRGRTDQSQREMESL